MKHLMNILFFSLLLFSCENFKKPVLYVYSSNINNLIRSLEEQRSFKVIHLKDLSEVNSVVPENSAVLILSENYPEEKTPLNEDFYRLLIERNIRAYIEYPSCVPNIHFIKSEEIKKQRVVVNSNFFDELDSLTILQLNGLSYIEVDKDLNNVHLVAAKVAGFDSAIYGLPEKVSPLLFEMPDSPMLISLTNLSNFITGRYSPNDAWCKLWEQILRYLLPDTRISSLIFEPSITTTYSKTEPLPADAQQKSIKLGIEWFKNAKMLIPPHYTDTLEFLRKNEIKQIKWDSEMTFGDGTLGVFECIFSEIDHDGSQPIGTFERGDCVSETAMAYATAGKLFNNSEYLEIAENLLDYYLFNSIALKGEYSNPISAAYGLIPWGINNEYWRGINYGDDNARFLLAAITTSSILDTDKWDDLIMKSLLGSLRTTGKNGFRGNLLSFNNFKEQNDWRYYFDRDIINLRPHFESYLWACYLWAYHKTGEELFLDRAQKGIDITMDNYPNGLTWTNGLSQEKARMILPLSWLIRISDNPKNRDYLNTVISDIMKLQDESGAIREEIGDIKMGRYPPPLTNEAYGTNEASLIAQNGDPVTDLLYTVNFALLGLHEASYATDDPTIKEMEEKLSDFLIRIQVKSEKHPEVHGGWMRAFDYNRFEHWGSNADHGWGAWCIETGWTQSWILSILSLREMKTSIWDISANATINDNFLSLKHMIAY